MKKTLMTIICSLLAVSLNASAHSDSDYYTISSIEVQEVGEIPAYLLANENGPQTWGVDCEPQLRTTDVVSWDEIVNIGQQVWDIIVNNQPVVNYTFQTAYAVPTGIQCWLDIEQWHQPYAKIYRVEYKNLMNMSVVTFNFRLNYLAGGNVRGIGQYLANVNIQPQNLAVAWGFNFDAKALVPVVFNTGTKANPLAGMQIEVNWTVKTPMKFEQRSSAFFIQGDGLSKYLDQQ